MAKENEDLKKLQDQQKQFAADQKNLASDLREVDKERLSLAKELASVVARREEFARKTIANEEAGRSKAAEYNRTMRVLLEEEEIQLKNKVDLEAQRLLSKEVELKKQEEINAKKQEEVAEEIKLEQKRSEALKKSKETLKTLGSQLKILLAIDKVTKAFAVTSLIEGLFKANEVTYNLSKQFGISLESARATREEYEEFAQTSTRIDFERLVKAQQDLGKAIGQNVQYSKEMAADFVEVTEYMGLSTETAGKLAQVGATLGQSSEEFRKGIADSLFPLNKSLGLNTNIKDLYEEVGKLSSTTIINLQRQGPELANLTQLAKRFGIEMQQISSFSESLLNFEQSIQAELEAEVLTGRELNLERARMAALRGDEVTLAREMAQQVGSITEFESMNVIQRESLAKAFGMNVESMSAMLLRQEAMNKLQGDAKKASDEQLAAARELMKLEGDKFKTLQEATEEIQKRETAQRKFEDAMRKLKTVLTDILSSLDGPLDKIAGVIKSFTESPMFKTLAKIGLGITAAGGIAKLISSTIGMIRGTRFMPMYVKMAGAGAGMGGMMTGGGQLGKGLYNTGGYYKNGKLVQAFAKPGQKGFGQIPAGSTRVAGGLTKMGRGLAGGGAAALAGVGVSALGSMAEDAGKEGLGYGLGVAGSALSMGGTGAMIGTMIAPGIGTAIGAGIGGVVGLFQGFLQEEKEDRQKAEEARQKREQEKAEKAEEARQKQLDVIRQLAEKEAKLYMDSNQVGLGLASGNNYAER